MKAYLCRPTRHDKPARLCCLGGIVLGVLVFYLSALIPQGKAIGQLISVLLLLAVAWISARCLLTDYRYGFENALLSFSSRQGRREKNLGSLPLKEDFLLLDREEWKKRKSEFSIKHRFSYHQNLFPPRPYYLLYPEEDGFILLIWEPDETLLSLLRGMERPEQGRSL